MNNTLAAVAGVALGLGLFLGSACGENEDEQAIKEAVLAVTAALNANDVEGFLAGVSDGFLADAFSPPPTREQLRASGLLASGEPQSEVSDLSNVRIAGDSATVDLWERQAQSAERLRISLIRAGELWLLDRVEILGVSTPGGATEMEVETVDNLFRFAGEQETFPTGDIAFQVTNRGAQPHNLFVLKLPEGVSVEEGYEAGDPADVGAQYVGLFFAVEPGEQGTWVLEDLEPGRYGYFCWIPDKLDLSPHAYLGMAGEFRAE